MTRCFCLTQNWPRRTWFYNLTVLLRTMEKLVRAKLALSALYISMTRRQNQKKYVKTPSGLTFIPICKNAIQNSTKYLCQTMRAWFFQETIYFDPFGVLIWLSHFCNRSVQIYTSTMTIFSDYNRNLRLILGLICKNAKLSFKSNYITWK